MKKIMGVFLVMLVGIFLLGTGSVQAEEKEPVVIGGLFPQTGVCAHIGAKEVKGVELAVEEINEFGGVLGRPFKVIIEDTESRPKAAIDAAHKLIDINKVPIILGCHASSNTIPTATYSNSKGVIQISVSSTSPDVRNIGPYHFSICGLDDIMGKHITRFAMEDSGKKKWGIFVMNDPYGVGIAKEMQKEIKRQGGEVVSLVKYELGKTDYRAELQRLFAPNPGGILSVGWGEIAAVQFKQAYELGLMEKIKGVWYVPYVGDIIGPAAIPDAIEGVKGLEYGYGSPRTIQFVQKFKEHYPGMEMISDAVRCYDACWTAALAINVAGSTEPDHILKVLPFVFSMYKGASSVDLEVDEDGMQKTQVYFAYIVHNGKLERYTKEAIGG